MSSIDKAMEPLRTRAELLVAARPSPISPDDLDVWHLHHELQVHQIEIELQNDELQRTNDQLTAMANDQKTVLRGLRHDFVQNVWALRMFLDAMANTSLDMEQRKIVGQLVSCVGSLDELSAVLSEVAGCDSDKLSAQQ